jgi:hypothetical protein
MRVLKPGGILLIEVPNAAEALKRGPLLGRTNYLPMTSFTTDWIIAVISAKYVLDDVHELARNLGPASYRMVGPTPMAANGWN